LELRNVLCAVALGATLATGSWGMSEASEIQMIDEGVVADDALYLTRAQFGDVITPHGDCIKIYKDYIYVTWYQGGMENRKVWLSRKKIGSGEWKHIEFPHRHVMFRKDRSMADAHNTIAVGICPKDDTIHLLYDMHAYTPKDFESDYFNYNVSKKGAATVSDDAWNIDLFQPKQNYLNKSIAEKNKRAYWRVTYPGFFTTRDGDLIVKWRIGGHMNAHMYLTKYDGEQWGEAFQWNRTVGEHTTGYYGSFRIFNDQMYSCWHRRTPQDQEAGWEINRGLYLAHCADRSGITNWYSVDGAEYELPLLDLEPFKVGEPSEPGQRISTGPSFVVTASGAFHAATTVSREAKHFFRTSTADTLTVETGMPSGDMYAIGETIYLIGLEKGRPIIQTTPEGTHDWQTVYQATDGPTYRRGVTILHERSLFYYLLENVEGDKRPLRVLRFDVDEK
jgi:hypothetical protein